MPIIAATATGIIRFVETIYPGGRSSIWLCALSGHISAVIDSETSGQLV